MGAWASKRVHLTNNSKLPRLGSGLSSAKMFWSRTRRHLLYVPSAALNPTESSCALFRHILWSMGPALCTGASNATYVWSKAQCELVAVYYICIELLLFGFDEQISVFPKHGLRMWALFAPKPAKLAPPGPELGNFQPHDYLHPNSISESATCRC